MSLLSVIPYNAAGKMDYLAYTQLLLHMDSQDQDTSITDSSIYTRTIIAGGNVKQSTSYKKFGFSSCLFDGTNSYLATPAFSEMQLDTSDFTLEMVSFPTALGASDVKVLCGTYNGTDGWQLHIATDGRVQFAVAGVVKFSSTATLQVGSTYTIALTRRNGTFYLYINGNLQATYSTVTNITGTATQFWIGNVPQANSARFYAGYIDEFRLCVGIAYYYGASASVPSTAFKPDGPTDEYYDKVKFLLHGDGLESSTAFVESKAGRTLTPAGGVIHSATKRKYGASALYFPNKSGNWLSLADAGGEFRLTGDFTLELSCYLTDLSTPTWLMRQWTPGNAGACAFVLAVGTDGSLQFGWYSGSATTSVTAAGVISTNVWNSIAVQRSGNTLYLIVNNIVAAMGTMSSDANPTSSALYIGGHPEVSGYCVKGYLDEIRLTVGQARYRVGSSNKSMIQSSPWDDTDTYASSVEVLIHGDEVAGSAPLDSKGKTLGGSALTATITGAYGSNAIQINSKLKSIAAGLLTPPGSKFTFEARVYPTGTNGSNYNLIWDTRSGVNTSDGIFLSYNTSYVPFLSYNGTAELTSSKALVQNSWNHVAVVRNGGTIYLFVNGVNAGSVAFTRTLSASAQWYGGANDSTSYMVGYLEEIRYTPNVDRYVTQTTAPLQAFDSSDSYYAYTNYLLHGDETAGSAPTDSKGKTITNVGSVVTAVAAKSFGGNAIDLQSASATSGKYLRISGLQAGGNCFTWEARVYPTGYNNTSYNFLWDSRSVNNATDGFVLSYNSTYFLNLGNSATFLTSSVALTPNAWNHVAVIRTGSYIALYINNALVGSYYLSIDLPLTTTTHYLGNGPDAASQVYAPKCLMEEVRYTVGIDRYTAIPQATAIYDASDVSYSKVGMLVHADRYNRNLPKDSKSGIQLNSVPNIVAVAGAFNGTAMQFDGAASAAGLGRHVVFGGTTLTAPGNTFTWEARVYPTGYNDASFNVLFDTRSAADVTTGLYLKYNSSYVLNVGYNGNNDLTASVAMTPNAWNHVALVRNGTTISLYLNGTRVAQNTSFSRTLTDTPMWIGCNCLFYHHMKGYQEEVRYTPGVALYSGATLTVPAAPFADNDASTQFLLHGDGIVGQPATGLLKGAVNTLISAQDGYISALVLSQAVAGAIGGQAAYFISRTSTTTAVDGSRMEFVTGRLTAPGNTFTWEARIYPMSCPSGSDAVIFDTRSIDTSALGLTLGYNSSYQLYVANTASKDLTTTAAMTLNAWNSVALVRNGSTLTVFLNGTQVGQLTNYTRTLTDTRMVIGTNVNYAFCVDAYMQEIRYTPGVARYSGAYTPATVAFDDNDATAQLLIHANDADGTPVKARLSGVVVTDTVSSTDTFLQAAYTSYSGKAIRLDGVSAALNGNRRLSVPAGVLTAPGTLFTWECRFYPTGYGDASYSGIMDTRAALNNATGITLYHGSDYIPKVGYNGTAELTSNTAMKLNRWNYLALTRNGNTLTLYLNGRQVAQSTTFTRTLSDTTMLIGSTVNYRYVNAYYEEIRYTPGVDRYSAGSASYVKVLNRSDDKPFGNIKWTDSYWKNVTTLLRFDGQDGDTTTTDVKGKTVTLTSATLSTEAARYGGCSLKLTAIASSAYIADASAFNFSSGDYTLEGWMYFTAVVTGDYCNFLCTNNNVYPGRWLIDFGVTATTMTARYVSENNGIVASGTAVPGSLNSWNHVAIVNDTASGTFRIYINGKISINRAALQLTNAGHIYIGKNSGAWTPQNYYIDDVRFTKGKARYKAEFTPPPCPFPEVAPV